MVTHVLLDEAIAIVTADNWVGQVHVFDLGLQLAAVLFRDLATSRPSLLPERAVVAFGGVHVLPLVILPVFVANARAAP